MQISSVERGVLQHYDQDPRIFEQFLDRTMKYSSGLFEDGPDDLDEAQQRKLAWVADCLGARPDARMLDVGCGWGSLILHLASRYGCRVVGITPSARQAEVVVRRAEALDVRDRVDVRIDYFQEHQFEANQFDGISFLGSIVHMVDQDAILAEAYRLLKRNGRLYLSESCFRNRRARETFIDRPGSRYIREEVFGWGDMLPLSRLTQSIEDAGFSLVGLRDLTADYFRTIEHWAGRVRARRAELEAIAPGTTEHLLHYFDIANAGWGFTTKHYAIVARKGR